MLEIEVGRDDDDEEGNDGEEIDLSGSVSSKDWCVQQETDLPGQESGAP
jgi:hypothetical protein